MAVHVEEPSSRFRKERRARGRPSRTRQAMVAIRKVMMVDDEPDIRRVGQMSLELIGKRQVCLAASGREALALAARERPDVILLDVMMPDLDGPATLALLRAQHSTAAIPVIFMTAKVQKREVERYLELGAAGVIYKPFDPMTLAGEVDRLAGAPAGDREQG